MLISKTAKVKWHYRNKKHYELKDYPFTKYGDEFEVKVKDLMKGSSAKVDVQCDGCGKEIKNIKWVEYLKSIKEDGKYYCHKCANKLYGYGVQHRLSEENIKTIILNNLGINWQLTEININKCTYVNLIDGNGYKYSNINIQNIKNSKGVNFVIKSNPNSIYNIKLWLKINKKPFELISDKYEGNKIPLKWKCLKDDCKEEFEMNWNAIISQNQGCPYCVGRQVGLSNCLAIKNPELASEWHSSLNGDLTPYDVTPNSNKKVWWQCSKNSKHKWSTSVKARKITNCPYCSGNLPSEDYNLLVMNYELCKEWDYNKNEKRPEEYTPGSMTKVWWKCNDCEHEWEAAIKERNKGVGCPECNKSKGEKRIDEILTNNIRIKISQEDFDQLIDDSKYSKNYFIPQMKFDGLVGLGNGLLSYDFYIPKYNFLIEYQGEQHERYIPGFHKSYDDFLKQLEHDKRKREYADINNINLLEIWYYDFDNIGNILSKYIK